MCKVCQLQQVKQICQAQRRRSVQIQVQSWHQYKI